MIGPMTANRLAALLENSPHPLVGVASEMDGRRLPVLEAFEGLLPDGGLRPGTISEVVGIGRTSLALALISEAAKDAWTAFVGMPDLGLLAASELGIDLERAVIVPDPEKKWVDVIASLVDAFDIVVARPSLSGRDARKLIGRVRERDAVVVTIGSFEGSEVGLHGTAARWHGLGSSGAGRLRSRSLDITCGGRRTSVPRKATLWLPDEEGRVRLADPSSTASLVAPVVKLAR